MVIPDWELGCFKMSCDSVIKHLLAVTARVFHTSLNSHRSQYFFSQHFSSQASLLAVKSFCHSFLENFSIASEPLKFSPACPIPVIVDPKTRIEQLKGILSDECWQFQKVSILKLIQMYETVS